MDCHCDRDARSLHWDALRSRRENLSLGLFKRFNLTCNSNLIANSFRSNQRTQRRHAHSKLLIEIRAKQDCYHWSFFLRSIRQWNNLPIKSSDLLDRKSTRLNSSHLKLSRMQSSA